jgi:hypothetical protein
LIDNNSLLKHVARKKEKKKVGQNFFYLRYISKIVQDPSVVVFKKGRLRFIL